MALTEKLNYLSDTKAAIKAAIEAKGVVVGSATFREYAQKVGAIPLWDDTLPWYGIEWDFNNPNPVVTRIGNLSLHASLPIQSLMAGCLLLDNGTVNYWLKPDDWTKKADGSASDLTGADGQVMVYVPQHWVKYEESLFMRRVKLSATAQDGFTQVPAFYVSAFEASVNRTTSKMASVVNTTADYRGGNNTSAWDGTYRSLLGKPVTNQSRDTFRTYARNRGSSNWNMYTYHVHKALFWLYMVEYANRQSQDPVNNNLTDQGFKQGGLGLGLTTLVSAQWNTFNSYNPLVNCGTSNSLGNGSGEVSATLTDYPTAGSTTNVVVNRYRGIENPFGHIWKNCDGIVINVQSVASGGESQVFVTTNPADFNDSLLNKTNVGLAARANGYSNKIIMGETGEIIATINGSLGASSTYWCDYYETTIPSSGVDIRTLSVGAAAIAGASAGFGLANTINAPSSAPANIGSRLCYLP